MKGGKSLELAWDREQEPVFSSPNPPPHTHTKRKQAVASLWLCAVGLSRVLGSPSTGEEGKKILRHLLGLS